MGKETDKTTTNKNGKEWTVPIWVAVITGAVTLLVALFTFPPFQRLFDLMPTSTLISIIELSSTPTVTATIIHTPTETFTPLPPIESITPTVTTTGLPIGMQVIVIPDPPGGKAPLTVKLDARDSFLRASNGDIFECRKGACRYIWYVYFNGQQFTEPMETRGTLELKFEKKGNYFISVYICHGAESPICGSGGTVIPVN